MIELVTAPKVTYVDHMGSDLSVVNAARISYANHSDVLDDRDVKLVEYLRKNGHWSCFEQAFASFVLDVPVFVARQIMRHRSLNFNEVSGRYKKLEPRFYYWEPGGYRAQHQTSHQCSDGLVQGTHQVDAAGLYRQHCHRAWEAYEHLLDLGVSREQARALLPLSIMTQVYVTGSLRSWIHFLQQRLDGHAQPECGLVAEKLKTRLMVLFPVSMGGVSSG